MFSSSFAVAPTVTVCVYSSNTLQSGPFLALHNNNNNYIRTKREIKMPRATAELAETKQGCYKVARMPCVVGCINGTFFPIKAPSVNEDVYVNRKKKNMSIHWTYRLWLTII